jgi:hypothetical protein
MKDGSLLPARSRFEPPQGVGSAEQRRAIGNDKVRGTLRERPDLLLALMMHPSAWKGASANFAQTAFSEVPQLT